MKLCFEGRKMGNGEVKALASFIFLILLIILIDLEDKHIDDFKTNFNNLYILSRLHKYISNNLIADVCFL